MSKKEDVKRAYLIGAIGSCCDFCWKSETCTFKLHPISQAPCIRCDEFEKGDRLHEQQG